MFKKFSIAVAGTGFASFLLIFGLVSYSRPAIGTFEWPMTAVVGSMVIGTLGFAVAHSREWRAKIRADLNL
jgi:hypothetical protein